MFQGLPLHDSFMTIPWSNTTVAVGRAEGVRRAIVAGDKE